MIFSSIIKRMSVLKKNEKFFPLFSVDEDSSFPGNETLNVFQKMITILEKEYPKIDEINKDSTVHQYKHLIDVLRDYVKQKNKITPFEEAILYHLVGILHECLSIKRNNNTFCDSIPYVLFSTFKELDEVKKLTDIWMEKEERTKNAEPAKPTPAAGGKRRSRRKSKKSKKSKKPKKKSLKRRRRTPKK